ncbi:hypothetical protein ACFOLD_08525 [Kocuria carniphila]|uniref:hypothetical protein n=1 Tax=Kocuria carniphila TaxID=262208 RepID=UPI00362234F4
MTGPAQPPDHPPAANTLSSGNPEKSARRRREVQRTGTRGTGNCWRGGVESPPPPSVAVFRGRVHELTHILPALPQTGLQDRATAPTSTGLRSEAAGLAVALLDGQALAPSQLRPVGPLARWPRPDRCVAEGATCARGRWQRH